ncbi:peptide-methionine (S)-S-oxide reductase MsrA [Robbsia sp. Bb-Pol-6]|uniref:Peptide methionine sulfoxide reductase MsrA n=1 Tax=Robbsia betulipollinis TaxID=2981849 RepID=A0ABT3ZGY9_9BURK|nr:peptide-methionine (S)-S-oxide reductase MsrA [Robbsia betulipollinis]MCY0385796.1 peptide-methionine (S)-S-oxide reductase MsrA [Robbsia betulipollinis]
MNTLNKPTAPAVPSRRRFRAVTPSLAGKLALAAAIGAGALSWQHAAYSVEEARVVPAPVQDEKAGPARLETAVVSGGCFWGVQGVFQHVRGVSKVVSGYSGGAASTAAYEMVSTGATGHAESVQITFDPARISYGRLLQIFFSVAHNPTERDMQGPDHGSQYRSAIFPQSREQAQVASAYIQQLNQGHVFPATVVTRVETFKGFYPAENYHQNYLTLHPDNPYIAVNDLPKVGYLKQYFPAAYTATPALLQVASAQ